MPRASVEALRRGEIIDGALGLIARDGYQAVTMRGLAAELGVSTGTITHWFATKDQILGAALDEAAARVERRIEAALDGVEDPEALLIALGDLSLPDDPDTVAEQRVWSEIGARAGRAPALAARHEDLYRGWRRRIERAVGAGLAAGAFRPVDPADWALAYAALLDGLAQHVLLHPTAVTPAIAREALRAHVRATLAVRGA